MEVADKCLDTRDLVCSVDGEQGVFCVGLVRRKLGCIWQEVEAPELSATGFTPTYEDGYVIWGKDCNIFLGESDCAVRVIYWINYDQFVLECRHDLACGGEGLD